MTQRVERFRKNLFTRAQAEEVAADHIKFGGAISSQVSEDPTSWIVTTELAPIAADDDAPAASASAVTAATAAGLGAAAGSVVAGPVGAMIGAAVGAGAAVAVATQRNVNLSAPVIPPARKAVAKQILDAFKAAGFGIDQQAAALANAIRESSLNPEAAAETEIEQSYGLFQLNTHGGLGNGHTKAELIKPEVNIEIIVNVAKKTDLFLHAGSLTTAVSAFVKQIERPANADDEIQHRLKIANALFA